MMSTSNSVQETQQPKQKLQAALSNINAKNLKHGIKAVMGGNRLGATLSSVTSSSSSRHHNHQQQQNQQQPPIGPVNKKYEISPDSTEQDDNNHNETKQQQQHKNIQLEELNIEDLATIPIVAGDSRESSMDLSDVVSQLRPSLHQKPRGLTAQDSPRGAEDWSGSGNLASTSANSVAAAPTAAAQGPTLVGSDSNLLHQPPDPMSPVAAASRIELLEHPSSAPVHLQSSSMGATSNKNNNNNNKSSTNHSAHGEKRYKFLGGKIKVSALKNFVGKGLDLSSSSSNHNHNNNKTETSSNKHRVGFATEMETVPDHRRRRSSDPHQSLAAAAAADIREDDFASPQLPKGGTGKKMAEKVRKSFIGLKSLAAISGKNVAAMLLDDDITESTEGGDVANITKASISHVSSLSQQREDTRETVHKASSQTNTITESSSIQKELDAAKHKRKQKHNKRLVKSNHTSLADVVASVNSTTTAMPEDAATAISKESKRSHAVRNRGGRLDPQAKERLKEYSEGNELRNRTAAQRLRRQKLIFSKHDSQRSESGSVTTFSKGELNHEEQQHQSSSRLDMSSSTGAQQDHKKDDVSPTPVKESVKPIRTTSTVASEGQSARKLKKNEDEKLRDRVRSRQSMLKQNGPVKEPSISLFELLERQDEKDNEDEGATFAEETSVMPPSLAPVDSDDTTKIQAVSKQDSNESLNDVFRKEDNTSGYMADSSSMMNGSSGLDLDLSGQGSSSLQGSFQLVESNRTDDYWQLKIDGVPMKESSPTHSPSSQPEEGSSAAAKTTIEAAVVKGEKKIIRGASKKHMADGVTSDVSESTRKQKGSTRTRSSHHHYHHYQHAEGNEGTKPTLKKKDPSKRRVKGEGGRDRSSTRRPHGEKSNRALSPRRHSEQTSIRHRKATVRDEAGHASLPVLSSSKIGHEDDVETKPASEPKLETETKLEATENEGAHQEYIDASAPTTSTADREGSRSSRSRDNKIRDGDDLAMQEQEDSNRREDANEPQRPSGVRKEKRADRKSVKGGTASIGGTSRHSTTTATAAKPSSKHRPVTRGRSEGVIKKAPSSRGRSEAARRENKRSPGSKPMKRRHSLESKRRPQPQDGEAKLEPTVRELGGSLANIRW